MSKPIFIGYRRFYYENMGWRWGLSLGIHWYRWRLDLHLLCWIISIGRVPLYQYGGCRPFASSDSFHFTTQNNIRTYYVRPRR